MNADEHFVEFLRNGESKHKFTNVACRTLRPVVSLGRSDMQITIEGIELDLFFREISF